MTDDNAMIVPSPHPMNPLDMIDRALSSGAAPETLEKLLTLQERWEANQARKAFDKAMSLARAKFKPIIKKHSGYGDRYKYEKLQDVADAIDAALIEHGFSYDWETETSADGGIVVTCVVRHEDGHSRKASLPGNPRDVADAKANMNGPQRMSAVVTYLQRGTLKAVLGLAVGDDTDGVVASSDILMEINADQFQELKNLLGESGETEERMLAFVKAERTETLTLAQYAKAKAAMVHKIAMKKKAA